MSRASRRRSGGARGLRVEDLPAEVRARLVLPEEPKPAPKPAEPSPLEVLLLSQIRLVGLPEPETEQRLIEGRKSRCDFVWRSHRVVMEVEGGIWAGGRHTRGKGFIRDVQKYNRLVLDGWTVLRTTSNQIKSGEAIETLRQALDRREVA